ncbi:indole-3-acetic acid-amido synthetase GH3.10 [Cynara cardunculus var. scolymus]|uniref:indole-3-acetic acid-amido synthetase GH3.10 n=1 Tax=Cynara cardunculus var. scolymus TaxID=59895 RepID=UPI000D626162|nr:indole-3-acetic acid-amido synthetase GH3.10 [Cynara cardunculus var. scolymus]
MEASSSEDMIIWFEEVAKNAGKVQMEILKKILEINHGVEYLEKWFGDIDVHKMDAEALQSLYTSMVPLASHADLEPYIQRIADGETSPLLTKQPITTLSLSSGTTEGRQKYVPFTSHSSKTTLQMFKLAAAYRSRVYPTKEGGKILEFIYGSKQFKTKGGLSAGTATTHYFASQEFKLKQQQTKSFTCSPEQVITSGDYKQSTYCHFLLGLFYSPDVEFITSTFAYCIVQALTLFEEYWIDLCNDLSQGTLSPRITLPGIRRSVLDLIKPNTHLATWVRAKCEELEGSDWYGLIPKLWPNCKYVYSIMTGSMQPYMEKLKHYAGDHLPLVSADYGSTESWIGVNMDPSCAPQNVTFTVVPAFSYFEFIPLHRQHHKPCDAVVAGGGGDDYLEDDPVPLSKVKIGQQYEIVLTTFTGLYRYRLGDVVEVSGFYKGTPKLNFLCRRKLILTVNIDKNTEQDLQLAVQKGSQPLIKSRAELVDFTSHANIVNQPGHYVVYWEIKGVVNEDVLDQCCKEMDAAFVDHGYVVSRKTNSIGPLELCIVERGTFKKIMEYFIGNGATMSQFKTPRCTTNQVLLKILNLYTIKRFRSTAYQ